MFRTTDDINDTFLHISEDTDLKKNDHQRDMRHSKRIFVLYDLI